MTRPEKLNELLDLLLVLQNSYSGVTYDELQEMYGFCRRRLERMISVISEKFGEKLEVIEHTTDRKKYFRLKKGTINSLISFTSNELANLEQLKEFINDENRKKEFNELIAKIRAINLKGSNSLETDISCLLEMQGYAVRQYSKEKSEFNTYEIIKDALLEQKKIQFNYPICKSVIIVHPYGIQFWEKNYLVCYSEYDKQILKYQISKISNIKKLDEYFEKDETFDLKKYSEESFGIFNSTQIKVELLFDKSVKEDVLNYYFHPTQKIIENYDGSVSVKFKASGMTEICWNLYKWEDKVKIVSPKELIDFYKSSLNNILKIYSK